MGAAFELENPRSVVIKPSRWQVDIIIETQEGNTEHYVASADSSLADSGIYWGTKEEFDEDKEGLW